MSAWLSHSSPSIRVPRPTASKCCFIYFVAVASTPSAVAACASAAVACACASGAAATSAAAAATFSSCAAATATFSSCAAATSPAAAATCAVAAAAAATSAPPPPPAAAAAAGTFHATPYVCAVVPRRCHAIRRSRSSELDAANRTRASIGKPASSLSANNIDDLELRDEAIFLHKRANPVIVSDLSNPMRLPGTRQVRQGQKGGKKWEHSYSRIWMYA